MLVWLAVLLLGATGCSVPISSWTGLTVSEGQVYASDVQQVQVLNATDGEVIWAFPADPKEENLGEFYATPAVNETYVIAASRMPPGGFLSQRQNIVWGLDAKTGQELWRFDEARDQYIEGGAINEDIVVIGNSDGNVYALEIATGKLLWKLETGHRVWATPLIVDDTVYVGSMDRHMYALDLSDGTVLWELETTGAFASAPVLHEGILFIGAFDNRLYAIDAAEGTERWHFQGENWFWGSPALYGTTLYAADTAGNVYALEAATGDRIWHVALEVPVRGGLAVSDDGTLLFVSSENGSLYALETSDGFERWKSEGEGQLFSSPVVSGTMVLEIRINSAEHIRALEVDDGRPAWVFPVEEE